MQPTTDHRRADYYRADLKSLNPGDATTRTLDPLDDKEYTYATTRLDVAQAIAAGHGNFRVYRVLLDEPIDVDPEAAENGLGDSFVRAPSGAVAAVVQGNKH